MVAMIFFNVFKTIDKVLRKTEITTCFRQKRHNEFYVITWDQALLWEFGGIRSALKKDVMKMDCRYVSQNRCGSRNHKDCSLNVEHIAESSSYCIGHYCIVLAFF